MALRDVFLIKESTDPKEWNLSPASEWTLKKFYAKYSQIVTMPNGSRGPYADFLLFMDDWEGDRSLGDAIESGDWAEIDRIAIQIMAEHPDPGGYDVRASAGLSSEKPIEKTPPKFRN
jgi:hypothetical protein